MMDTIQERFLDRRLEQQIRKLGHVKAGGIPFSKKIPTKKGMNNGESRYHMDVDGTLYLYTKQNNKLYLSQFTEVT
jgi:hypothetical protein